MQITQRAFSGARAGSNSLTPTQVTTWLGCAGVTRAPARTAPLQPQQAQQRRIKAMASVKDLQATPGVCASPDAATKVRDLADAADLIVMHPPLCHHLLGEASAGAMELLACST